MEITPTRQSAKILMFPVAARASASNLSGKAKFAAELASLRNRADFGSGWYHEAAVEEAKQDRKS
ncbi:MAG: DUF2735 domain-containing protein [Mesorhizobium sp.]|uniref:DUF2735 domain-containing protein n=1 Tax=Mesorhizobium sp. TaxID=1871066 RepID=UPI000FE7D47B|nr:DUF2735 domain-containing protein [Mesorhizobium sp.]RWB32626.1 MAG: DUF2735 domain-containing protein [Mesorhizobium sp.]RWD29000.1 MAG: DUF2735 domain-containing protein [Mesorhizobium sp.]RWD41641.1 MAG: DUF2735 domain-containing protein [Mesorhizobium sp.]RWD77566.1 MAG: DUF2735 domain-containing protein [Mesorhizobium sp.]TIS37835.1 MAG: DUF2735 domain-containing protein [Mesorhizobium sp.]